MNTRNLLVSGLMLVSILLAACAPAVTPLSLTIAPPTDSATPTSLVSDPKALATVTGNYTYRVGKTFNFILNADGSYISLASSGKFTVTADQITFVENGSECASQPGIYKWSLENNNLHLTLTTDNCQHRVNVFGTQAFEKVPENNTSATVISESTQTTTLPSAGKLIATIPVGAGPLALAVGEGAVWVKNGSGDVLRIDPSTNQVVATIHVGGGQYGYITVGEEAVWASLFDSNMVARIDPQTNKVVANIPVGHAPEGIGVTPGAVWVANHHDGSVSRIDTATNMVTNTITDVGSVGRNGPLYLVTGAGAVWVEVPNINAVVRIDPATNAIVAKFPGYTGAVAADFGSVWYGTTSGLSQIDPSTNMIVSTIPASTQKDFPQVAIGLGSVWLKTDKILLRIDPQTNQIVGQMQIPGGGDMAIGEGSIWISVEDSQSLLRIEPAP